MICHAGNILKRAVKEDENGADALFRIILLGSEVANVGPEENILCSKHKHLKLAQYS